jgi:hypothetical protein
LRVFSLFLVIPLYQYDGYVIAQVKEN